MKFDGTDLYAALIHELKNDLGLLSMTIDGIPRQGTAGHDGPVDAARLLCQNVVDRLQQALLIYKAIDQPIRPAIDAWSPHDAGARNPGPGGSARARPHPGRSRAGAGRA